MANTNDDDMLKRDDDTNQGYDVPDVGRRDTGDGSTGLMDDDVDDDLDDTM